MTRTATMSGRGAGPMSLRSLLAIDAVTGVAMGAVLVAGATSLAGPLGLPAPLLLWAGLVLFPCAALMAVAAVPASPPLTVAWLVIVGNFAWVLASIAVLPWFAPSALGVAFVLAQAAVVLVLAVLERRALAASA